MPLVLLVTSSDWSDGEPGFPALDLALTTRDVESRWVVWDDESVDWAAADLVAVRSTWDYVERHRQFVEWARQVETRARVLNGADVFEWNVDKAYLARLGQDVPVVPTELADDAAEIWQRIEQFGTAVIKSRVGAGGFGVVVADRADDPRLAELGAGPWVVQPLVESVRTEGETSVFVLGGTPVSQVDKVPGGDEIRVHEHFGGASTPVPLRDEAAELAVKAFAAAKALLGTTLDYGRADMMRLGDGTLAISELELVEPGLYLDVLPANAEPFADLVVAALRRR